MEGASCRCPKCRGTASIVMRKPSEYLFGARCDLCRVSIREDLMRRGFLHCRGCKFDLCSNCLQLDQFRGVVSAEVPTLPSTKCPANHDMTMMTFPPPTYNLTTGNITCDMCRTRIDPFGGFRHCSACQYDLCPLCAKQRSFGGASATQGNCAGSIFCRLKHAMTPLRPGMPTETCLECAKRFSSGQETFCCNICSAYLCATCSQMPKYNIIAMCPSRHRLIPSNTAPLAGMSRPVLCNNCNGNISFENGYQRCGDCNFNLCLECVVIPKFSPERIMSLQGITSYCKRSHTMNYMVTAPSEYVSGITRCDSCRNRIDHSTGYTHCVPCNFDLCNSCFKLPKFSQPSQITSYCPASHLMTYSEAPPLDFLVGVTRCDNCNVRVDHSAGYTRCKPCNFDLCNQCYKLPRFVAPPGPIAAATSASDIPVATAYSLPIASTAAPSVAADPSRVLCNQGHRTEFYISQLPDTYKNLNVATSAIFCDRCQVRININDGLQHCSQCQFDICVVCSLPPRLDQLTLGGVPLPVAAPSLSNPGFPPAPPVENTNCRNGHRLMTLICDPPGYKNRGHANCDVCGTRIIYELSFRHCEICSFDLCPSCYYADITLEEVD